MRSILLGPVSAVLALAACTSTTNGSPGETSQGTSELVVSCSAVVPGTGAEPDRTTIEARARSMTPGTARVEVAGDRVTVTLPEPSPSADADALCRDAVFQFRGLIAPAQPITCRSTGCSSDPFAGVVSADPSLQAVLAHAPSSLNAESCPSPSMPSLGGQTAACHAFSDLSVSQQRRILAALQHYDCSAAQHETNVPSGYLIACDTGSTGETAAYLLGHAIVDGTEIEAATAQAPSISTGNVEWTIDLKLTGSGADAWRAWTSKYNTHGQPGGSPIQTSSTPPCGQSAAVPCSDFVGFVLDGQVLSAPVTLAELSTETQISGGFTGSSAKALASALSGGALPVPLKVTSVTHTR